MADTPCMLSIDVFTVAFIVQLAVLEEGAVHSCVKLHSLAGVLHTEEYVPNDPHAAVKGVVALFMALVPVIVAVIFRVITSPNEYAV